MLLTAPPGNVSDRSAVGKGRPRISLKLFAAWIVLLLALSPVGAMPAPVAQGESGQDAAENGAEQEVTRSEATEIDEAARLFVNRCTGCHTIEGGDLAGPDLLPSTRWPESDLEQATRRMQQNVGPLTDRQIDMLVDFMKLDDVRKRLEEARTKLEQQAFSGQAEEGSADVGRQLFFGSRDLENSGTACMACHQVNGVGGTLAADLSRASERLGRMPLISGIRQSGFPVMNAAYRDHPVTDQEALHLAAYFEAAAEDQAEPDPGAVSTLYFISTGASILLLVSLSYFYRNRNRGVRSRLVRENSRRGTA